MSRLLPGDDGRISERLRELAEESDARRALRTARQSGGRLLAKNEALELRGLRPAPLVGAGWAAFFDEAARVVGGHA